MEQRPPEGLGSRDRILWAAATMLQDEPGAALSVRAVAARAGVSTGSLQHHFPKQRELMDAVLTLVYDLVLPEESVHDSSIPARERLIACLQRLLAPAEPDVRPRDAWRQTFDRYVAGEPTENVREEYLAIERELRRRIEHCLTVLQNEGSIADGDNASRARFLYTVVTGLSIGQVLPAEASFPQTEIEVLRTAVDYVLGSRP